MLSSKFEARRNLFQKRIKLGDVSVNLSSHLVAIKGVTRSIVRYLVGVVCKIRQLGIDVEQCYLLRSRKGDAGILELLQTSFSWRDRASRIGSERNYIHAGRTDFKGLIDLMSARSNVATGLCYSNPNSLRIAIFLNLPEQKRTTDSAYRASDRTKQRGDCVGQFPTKRYGNGNAKDEADYPNEQHQAVRRYPGNKLSHFSFPLWMTPNSAQRACKKWSLQGVIRAASTARTAL